MPKTRSYNREHSNLFVQKKSFLQRKNFRQPLKYKKNVVTNNRSTQISNVIREPCSIKRNKLTTLLKQKVHTWAFSKKPLKTVPQKSPKRITAARSSSRLKITLKPKEVTAADKIKSQLKSKKQLLDKKAPCISQLKQHKSSNKSKKPSFHRNSLRAQSNCKSQEQNERHCNAGLAVIDVSGFLQESPDKAARSTRSSRLLQPQEFSKNNSDKGRLSDMPESKSLETVPQKSQKRITSARRSSSRLKIALHPKEVTAANKVKSQLKSKKQQDKLDKKASCSFQLKQHKSSNKGKKPSFHRNSLRAQSNCKSQEQNERHCNAGVAVIDVSGFLQDSPDKAARSTRSSRLLQPQEFSKNNSNKVRLSDMPESKSLETVPQKSQKRITSARRSSSRLKIALHPKEVTAANKIKSQLKSNKQQDNLDKKASCSFQLKQHKSSNKSKKPSFHRNSLRAQSNRKSQEQNERHCNTGIAVIGVSGFLHESPDETPRSSKQLQSQEFSENNSDKMRLSDLSESKCFRNSTVKIKKPKAKRQMTEGKKFNRHSAPAPNFTSKKKRCVEKSSAKLKKSLKSQTIFDIPVDDLALSFITRKTKSDGCKLPGRNTLKRKRLIMEEMKKVDEAYEDDIYEEKQFTSYREFFPDTSDSESSYSFSTPKPEFLLTPKIRCKTPAYTDCFSPTEYALSRKVAEECYYRNKKRKSNPQVKTPAVPEKKKLEFSEIVEKACKVHKEVEKLVSVESDCEDNYYTDDEI